MSIVKADLKMCLDPDLCGLILYSGQPVIMATDEGSKVGLWFPADIVAQKQAELASGKSLVEVLRWSATIRSLHSEYLCRAARMAMHNAESELDSPSSLAWYAIRGKREVPNGNFRSR